MSTSLPAPLDLGPMPAGRRMTTVDERLVRAPLVRIFSLAADVERWPALLPHYRYVRYVEHRADGGGIVDMSANRPFGLLHWPTWWRSRMRVHRPVGTDAPRIRFTHIGGVTTGMDVEWSFVEVAAGTHVRIVHVWDGPDIPVVGAVAATMVIGPVFVHGIASRTLAGLAAAAERPAA
jgi:ribosome-associated toxin RatA of RatAB toxin-antitoxin module